MRQPVFLLLLAIILTVQSQLLEYESPGGSKYDIAEISQTTFKVLSGTSEYYVRLNSEPSYFCGSGQSVCKKTETSSISLGKWETSQFSESFDGDDSMGFVVKLSDGQACKESVHYSSTIIFSCSSAESSHVMLTEDENCEAVLSIGTPLACPKNRRLNCVHSFQGHEYDFTQLGMVSMSYTDNAKNELVKVRICDRHPSCQADEDACVVNQNNAHLHALGKVSEEVYSLVDNPSAVKITYANYNTEIHLFCAQNNKNEITDVEYEDKTLIFISSPHACAVNPGPGPGPDPDPEPEPEPEPEPDELEDKIHYTSSDGYIYDLSYFEANDVIATLEDETRVYIRVGAEPGGLTCGEGRSVCMEKPSGGILSAGTIQSQQFEDGVDPAMGLSVDYKNGNTCSETDGVSTRFHSSIEFFCDEAIDNYEVVDAQLNGCRLVVFVNTKYACPTNADDLDCAYTSPDGRRFDLTDLKGSTFYSKVSESNDDFYYSVCGTCSQCGTGASACVISNGVKTITGLTSTSKFELDEDVLMMKFSYGDNNAVHTSVYFGCDAGATNFLTEQVVKMDTSYVVSTTSKQGCVISSCSLGSHDFMPLSGITFTKTLNADSVSFRICDVLYEGTDTAAELTTANNKVVTGKLSTQAISNFEPTVALISYTDGDMSPENVKGETHIYLGCDASKEYEITNLEINSASFSVSIFMNTKYMCKMEDSSDSDPSDPSDPSKPWVKPDSSSSFPWWILIIGIILLIVVGYFCFGIIYNLVKGKTGIEVVPHSHIWCCCMQPKTPKYVALPT